MVGSARTVVTAACIALAGLLTGCAVSGSPTAAEPDVRTLEVGTYQVDRYRYDQDAGGNGALLEGMRMSDAVVPAVQIDPSLRYGRGSTVIANTREAIKFLAKVSEPVLDNRKMVVGFAVSGADRPDTPAPSGDTRPGPDATAVTNVVLRFADDATAKFAARELEDADIGVSPDNRKLPSTTYPDSYIHWRPGVPSVGAFLAHKQFVISLFIQRPRADGADLVTWVDKTFAAEIPALDGFAATPQNKLDDLQVDPEGLLARVTVADRAGHTPDSRDFAVYGPNYLVHLADDENARQQLLGQAGVERIGLVSGGSVTRVRDYAAAHNLITGLIDTAGSHYGPIDAPSDVPGAQCLQLNSSGNTNREYKFRCYVPYKRYVGMVTSDREPDVRQKITAQYALLANSL